MRMVMPVYPLENNALKIINKAAANVVYANIFFNLSGLVLIANLPPMSPPRTATNANGIAPLGQNALE